MAAVDFRGAYGLLRRVMEQQELERQGANYGSMPSAAPPSDSSSYGNPQGGLLGRLIELQEEQTRYQPSPAESLSTSRPQDPNFPQLTRVDRWPRGGTPPSDDEIYSRNEGTGLGAPGRASQGAGVSATPGYVPAPRWGVAFGGGGPLPFSGRGGRTLPFPPMGPGSMQDISIPTIPDWWKAAGPVLRRVLSGASGDGGDDYSRCTRAADGSIEQWEEFCRNLARKQNNTVGGESQNRACWSKTNESPTNRTQWCENQFGNR